jgi:hypothetical protein
MTKVILPVNSIEEKIWKESEGRYIYFVEELDCFNTEQCCAFLYKLMEYIQIARKTKRTLVIPNIYLTPRDNPKILTEKKVIIKKAEYISIDNFIELDDLKKACNIITATDYFDNLLIKKIKSILISKNNIDVPLINNKLFTYIGKVAIEDNIKYDFNSLNILNILTNDIMNDFESIIIYNYNRMGNPNWFNIEGLEYFSIRHNIVFKKYLKDKANQFVKENKIREESTLMFHWRRGDIANVSKNQYHMTGDENTFNYFKEKDRLCSIENVVPKLSNIIDKYNIKQLLLITNNGDQNELDDLKLLLEYKNVKLIELPNQVEYINLDYHMFDIFSIIVGAQCKYHLHSPNNYQRMSMFGRWMIEEKEHMENISWLE